MTVETVARIIILKVGDFGEETLISVRKGTTALFKLSSDLYGSPVKLFINYKKDGFERANFYQVNFSDQDFDEETFARVEIECSGTFKFYFTVGSTPSKPCGGGYIVADPELKIGNNETLSLDSIAIITYLTKSLGNFKDWEGRLTVAKESGYNFIHFTPVQSLGSSNSSYSILNQLELNPIFGNVTWESLKSLIERMQKDWGILSLCDVVLNHTANETPWLKTNPEATYNLANCPHLIPPYLIDRVLVSLTDAIASGKLTNRGLPPAINSEEHLNSLRIVLHERLAELRLEEFYYIQTGVNNQVNGTSAIKGTADGVVVSHSYKRFGSRVNRDIPAWEIDQLNDTTKVLIGIHLSAAVENVIAGVRYERIESGGPKLQIVDRARPIIQRYFEEIGIEKELQSMTAEEIALSPSTAPFVQAHNGWVMNDDPLRNFADADSNVYLRREVIAWGDSIKLRYGSCPEDSPFLWNLMKEYVQLVSTVFHGLRLDNCHSTPLHVAEYLLDAGRKVRPELFVVAELFTNSDGKDNVFVNHLGINSLIRECQQAWDSHEQGRLLFRFGGKPVGAFENTIPPAIAKAILFDQTHDNPSAITKRSIRDLLPTAALVAVGNCGLGSTRGYDDIVPHHIHVVTEKRFYTSFTTKESHALEEIGLKDGLLRARMSLNRLHQFLGQDGYSETFIDQLDKDVIAATRHNPKTRESVILVSYTAFSPTPDNFRKGPHTIRAVEIDGDINQILFEGRLIPGSVKFVADLTYLRGQDAELVWREGEESKFINIVKWEGKSRIEFIDFQPGDIVAVKSVPYESVRNSLQTFTKLFESDELDKIVGKLSLLDLNHVLYRCREEEGSVYSIPNWPDPVYAGLQGIEGVLEEIARTNDLGHPLCSNLRNGNWLMEYTASRLISKAQTKELGVYLEKIFKIVGSFPRFLVPTYFEQVFRKTYNACLEQVWKLMDVASKGDFVKRLALTSVQFVGIAEGGALPAGGSEYNFLEDERPFISYSLCAGLPHFSTGYMRSWGRDTFISLPGILILTKRYEEAKQHILSYGSVMSNGLIPNLLNKGNCRYNCRDATWWWLYSIVRYIELVPNGVEILSEKVRHEEGGQPLKLEDIMHSTIQSHFDGISFREKNAGSRIDAHMRDEGFNIDVWVDTFTGFIHGGNAYNCGTWMDKMGSSDSGGNRGIPATPRDGACVEIVGLSAAVLRSLWKTKEYSHKFVQRSTGFCWTYNEWYLAIKTNFEPLYFVSETSNSELVNQRNIYKDTIGASNKFGDFQLRPNFLIAMTVAPELFDEKNAILALRSAQDKLVSVLGVKTLDQSDWNFRGDYFNSDSSDYKTACGFNYHQGPEWLWPIGFYLRALIRHSPETGPAESKRILSKHYEYLKASPWRSLPELTNENGKVCPGSCTAQAWSCATLLEVFQDLEDLKKSKGGC